MRAKPQIKDVPLSLLSVDMVVQRVLDMSRAKAIAADLDLDAIGTLCASLRDNGRYYLVDGQHRAEALRIYGFTTEPVRCEVYIGLSLPEEAAMFRMRNNTRKPSALDKFRIRLVEGDEVATGVMDLLRFHGWALPNTEDSEAKGRFAAVTTIEHIYVADATVADRVITTMTLAWGHRQLDYRLIEGLGKVFLRYGFGIDQESMVERLSVFPGGPDAIIARARQLRDLIQAQGSSAYAELIVEIYNKNRRTRALPSWRSAQ